MQTNDQKLSKVLNMIGGTVLCGSYQLPDEDKPYDRPIYTQAHIMLAHAVSGNSDYLTPEKQDELYKRILATKDILFEMKFDFADDQAMGQKLMFNFVAEMDEIREEINRLTPPDRDLSKGTFSRSGDDIEINVIASMDSINLDLSGKTVKKLQEKARESFEKCSHQEISGGTDTLQTYSTAIALDLNSRGYFDEGKDNKLFFISSMQSMEANLPHNAKLFGISDILAADSRLGPGAYVLSSADKEANKVYVHDPLNDLVKISSKIHDAFRSRQPVGWVEDGEFHPNPKYKKPEIDFKLEDGVERNKLSRVAPPILYGTELSETVHVLGAYLNKKKPFDAVVIEFNQDQMVGSNKNWENFKELVKAHRERGTRVIVNNFLRYDYNTSSIIPKIENEKFESNIYVKQLEELGAVISTKTTKDASVMEVLRPRGERIIEIPALSEKLQDFLDTGPAPTAILGYIPEFKAMKKSYELLGGAIEHPVIAGLPGNTLPEEVIESLKNSFQSRFSVSFVENGQVYQKLDGSKHVEGATETTYAAGAASSKFSTHTKRPEEAAQDVRKSLGKGDGLVLF